MKRPYIICHMMQSLDGRVACDMVDKISGNEYYDALDQLDCQAKCETIGAICVITKWQSDLL